jgi:hypothetical protein
MGEAGLRTLLVQVWRWSSGSKSDAQGARMVFVPNLYPGGPCFQQTLRLIWLNLDDSTMIGDAIQAGLEV